MAHPWHDIPLSAGEVAERLPVVIEIAAGSSHKYELDMKTALLTLDRVLPVGSAYPANYGFIPRTLGRDRDALDALVLSREPVQPLTVVRARPVGLMRMQDGESRDDKVIAVLCTDPQFAEVRELDGLPPALLASFAAFFEAYKALESTSVSVCSFDGREAALQAIGRAAREYSAGRGPLIASGDPVVPVRLSPRR